MRTFILMLLATSAIGAADAPAQQRPPVACAARAFDIYFESWQAALTPDAEAQIKAQQRALEGCAIRRVRIVGMAGALGDDASNQRISQQRADAIATLLEAGGWPRSAFEIQAIGERNATAGDANRPMRRRVHIDIEAAAP